MPATRRRKASYRQWVWSMPRAVRLWLARDGARITRVHALFLRAIFAWQRRAARDRGIVGGAQSGAVTFIQRFGGQLNLNVHFLDARGEHRTYGS